MRKHVQNILAVYSQATAEEREAGMHWYDCAHDQCVKLHDNIAIGSAIVAAVSPGLRWERNIEAARRVIAGESLDGLGVRWYANVGKATLILNGHDPRIVLGGFKVRAFWQCIMNPLDWMHVCVDGHAYAIWSGKRIALDETPNLARGGRYQRIACDYMRAADALNVLPMQVQAITWVTWRRLHGVANGGAGHRD